MSAATRADESAVLEPLAFDPETCMWENPGCDLPATWEAFCTGCSELLGHICDTHCVITRDDIRPAWCLFCGMRGRPRDIVRLDRIGASA